MLIVTIPIRTVSEANTRGHWAKRARRAKEQRGLVALVLRARAKAPNLVGVPSLGILVHVTRVAPRELDSHDNLRASLKACVDGVADWMCINDRDKRVEWAYGQERGKPREYAVRVRVAPRRAA